MDITPVYELKSRLRAAAIAGAGLIKEDFRLARAIEGFKPLAGASPVFKKIVELSDTLISDDCPDTAGTLLDLLSLTDSVVCTLGVTSVKGEVSDLEAPAQGNIVINAPYSVLHEILSALTTSGSGHYNFLVDQHDLNKQLFSDYRVRPALVQALGASYSETANEAENWLCEQGKAVIPLLKKGFDPKGKKEMARRVKVIEMISGAEENAFYLEQLDNSAKDIRYRLIYALRHSKENVGRLIELCDKEKAGKKYAMAALAQIDCDESIGYFKKLAEKKPLDALEGLEYGNSDRACDLFADILNDILTKDGKALTIKEYIKNNKTVPDFRYLFFGKHGKKVQDILRRNEDYSDLASWIISTLIYTADEDMMRFTEQWYNETKSEKVKVELMPALIAAKLMSKEDCTDWLREFLAAKGNIDGKKAAAVTKKAAALTMRYIELSEDGSDSFDLVLTPLDVFDDRTERRQRINQSMDKITDVLIDNADWDITQNLGSLAWDMKQSNCGEKLRQKLGEFFSKLARVDPSVQLVDYMKACGRTDFQGLTAILCKNDADKVNLSYVNSFVFSLGLSDEESAAELMDVAGKLRSGELKCKRLTADELENWAHRNWNMP